MRRFWVLNLILMASIFGLQYRTSLASTLISNVAWLQLINLLFDQLPSEKSISHTLNQFNLATAVDKDNHRAYFGKGISYRALGNFDDAQLNWQRAGIASQTLIAYGDWKKANQNWDEALFYYRGASHPDTQLANQSQFLAANICQLFLVELRKLNASNQIYCQTYFSQNDGNFIVNGQFREGSTLSWGERYFSDQISVVYGVDKLTGKSAPAASIIGLTDDYHGGLFQRIALPPGAMIRYSAWLKIEKKGKMDAQVLYMGGRKDNKPFGISLETISNNMEWTFLEKVFQAPEADSQLLTFFPVLLTGQGTVWIDNVRLGKYLEQWFWIPLTVCAAVLIYVNIVKLIMQTSPFGNKKFSYRRRIN